jgi:hypothetical protein
MFERLILFAIVRKKQGYYPYSTLICSCPCRVRLSRRSCCSVEVITFPVGLVRALIMALHVYRLAHGRSGKSNKDYYIVKKLFEPLILITDGFEEVKHRVNSNAELYKIAIQLFAFESCD